MTALLLAAALLADPTDKPKAEPPKGPTADELIAAAVKTHPDIKVAEAKVKVAEAELAEAKAVAVGAKKVEEVDVAAARMKIAEARAEVARAKVEQAKLAVGLKVTAAVIKVEAAKGKVEQGELGVLLLKRLDALPSVSAIELATAKLAVPLLAAAKAELAAAEAELKLLVGSGAKK